MAYNECPQCADIAHFTTVGIQSHTDRIHEEAVREANEHAKTMATTDYATCSLSWNKLWIVHFTEKFETLYKQKRAKVISDYETACYKKSYGGRETEDSICCYHSEFRDVTY